MRKPWNIADRLEVLKDRFDDGIAYAVFADAQINAADALNMLVSVLLKTGVFQAKYEEWHALPRGDRTLANTCLWWGMKKRLKRKIGEVAGEMGRGQSTEATMLTKISLSQRATRSMRRSSKNLHAGTQAPSKQSATSRSKFNNKQWR